MITLPVAAKFTAPECEALVEIEEFEAAKSVYGEGLLWRVSKVGMASNYVFGTIHVADEVINDLPEQLTRALNDAQVFAMEVLPEPADLASLANMMYFRDGRKLSDLLSQPLFNEVVRLLGKYHLPEEAVVSMKPWAAFLTMNYPPESGQVLDMQLLALARKNGAKLIGLETIEEQIEIFDSMTLDKQLQFLSDTACHYDAVEANFEEMKALYIAGDLAGLYAFAQRHSLPDDEMYNALMKTLIINRNYTMTKRMEVLMQKGFAFVAIGAMHLAGEEGVLSLLAKSGYEISLIY